ncbi:hypothetical protein [Acinetobacter brisouii]
MNRDAFEKTSNIKHFINLCAFDSDQDEYTSERLPEYSLGFINGAWWMWQEQQKLINNQSECVKNLVTQRNNESNKIQASLLLIDNFFDDQRQTPSSRQYANFIQEIYETLRGNDQTQESQACDHTMVEKTQFGDLERSFECIFCDHKTTEAWVTKHE